MPDLSAPPETQGKLELLGEAYRRGLLPPDRARLYEEGQKRGLFGPKPQAVVPSGQMAPGGALADPNNPPGDTQIGIGMETPGGAPAVQRQQRSAFDLMSERAGGVKDDMKLLQGYDPSVDYDTGTGWTDAVAMHRADTPDEKRAYLSKAYGLENVFTDRGGRFVVRAEGKMMSPEGTGFMNNLMRGGASLYASAPEVAGMIGGGMVGAPAGPLGAAAGAAAGGALGKTAIEGSKVLEGTFKKDLPETARSIGIAGAYGGAGEGLGRLVSGIPGALGAGFRKYITGTTPEARDLAASVQRSGGVAPLRSVAPGLSSPIQKQDISARLGADWLEDPNRAAVQSRLGEIVGSEFPAAERPGVMREIMDPTARVSSREAGTGVQNEVRLHGAQLEADVDNLARDADRMLTQQLGQLNAISRRAPAGNLGADVAAGITQARQDFGTAMGNIYARADQMTGGAEVVPTGAIKRQARQLAEALPPDAQGKPIFSDPNVLRAIEQANAAGPKIKLSDAISIRRKLGEMGELDDLVPPSAKRQFLDLRQSVNTALDVAARDPATAPAIKMLRTADRMYADGIRKFGDSTVNQLVNQAKTGMTPDAGAIADKVLQPRFVPRAREIKQMVGPDVWRRVASADWENVVANVRDPETGKMSSSKLATIMEKKDRDGLLELTYGPKLAGEMRLYSKRLSARGGDIPAGQLTPDNFGQAMQRLETANLTRDSFLKNNFLSELSKPGSMADDAVNYVLRPGQEQRLIEAQRFFGDQSPQMQSIRQQALKELLNSAITRTETGAGTTVVGDGIDQALRKWTPRQQEIMFPGGLADDMRRLAQEIRFMFPRRGDQLGGALIAGAVKNLPLPARIPALAYYEGMGWIFSQPRVVKAIANGLEPGAKKAATRETIRMIFREAAVGQLPHPDETPEPGVMDAGKAATTLMGRNYGIGAQRAPIPRGLRGAPQPAQLPGPSGRRQEPEGEYIEPRAAIAGP